MRVRILTHFAQYRRSRHFVQARKYANTGSATLNNSAAHSSKTSVSTKRRCTNFARNVSLACRFCLINKTCVKTLVSKS